MAHNRVHVNNFATTLDGNITDVATTINVTDATGLPTDFSVDEFRLTMSDGAQVEIVEVTGRTGNALTVVRAQEGTSGYAFLDLDPIELLVTADSIDRKMDVTDSPAPTGLTDGGVLSINADTTKFDISAGLGRHIDSFTDPSNPVLTKIEWSAFTAQTVTNIATTPRTYVALDSAGAIVQQSTEFTPAQRRSYIILGLLVHPDNINVVGTICTPITTFDLALQLVDFIQVIGPTNVSGNTYSANGVNLNLNKSAGEQYRLGVNCTTSAQNPSIATVAAGTALSFNYRYQDGAGDFTEVASGTAVVPGSYDDGDGTLGTVPSNRYTIQYIFMFADGGTRIMYGQTLYTSLAAAEAALSGEVFNSDPNLLSNANLRGWLIVKGNATDLTDTSTAKFIEADLFGLAASGGGSSSTTTLQQAYNNSDEPEIVLTSTRGAFNIQDNATPLAATLWSVSNNGGTIDYIAADDDGFYVHTEDARTNTVDYNVTFTATTTGTPAAGIGIGALFRAESADEAPSEFGALNFTATDVGAGTEDTDFVIRTRVAGAALADAYKMRVTTANNYIMTGAPTAERTITFPDRDVVLGDLAWEKIAEATASVSSTIDFTDLTSTYYAYVVVIEALVVSSDDSILYFRTSTDNGSTFDSGASDYDYYTDGGSSGAATVTTSSAAVNIIAIHPGGGAHGIGNAANESYSGQVTIFNPSAAKHTHVMAYSSWVNTLGNVEVGRSSGRRMAATDVDAIRFLMSAGTMTSGKFILYGIRA